MTLLLALLFGCTTYPSIDEIEVERIIIHTTKDFVDFEFVPKHTKGEPCVVVDGLSGARLNGRKPVITKIGGRDVVLERTTGKQRCFNQLIAFQGLGEVANEDLELTLVTQGKPWAIKIGNAPLMPRTITVIGELDGREVAGTTVKLTLDPPGPIIPEAIVYIASERDVLVAKYAIADAAFRSDGTTVEVDIPDNVAVVGILRFGDLWKPTITGCPDGVPCELLTPMIQANVPVSAIAHIQEKVELPYWVK